MIFMLQDPFLQIAGYTNVQDRISGIRHKVDIPFFTHKSILYAFTDSESSSE